MPDDRDCTVCGCSRNVDGCRVYSGLLPWVGQSHEGLRSPQEQAALDNACHNAVSLFDEIERRAAPRHTVELPAPD